MASFPFFSAPTANVTVPLACAIITFVYFNWQGLKHHGPAGYAKHFAGPVWWLSPLMFPVEIHQHHGAFALADRSSLGQHFCQRSDLWIVSGLVYRTRRCGPGRSPDCWALFWACFPALVPIAFILLHVFVSVVQTYVFAILPAVYIGLATADEH